MRFKILGSSSSGNAALLQTEACSVLIDAGFSGKKLEALLATESLSLEQIDAVFLTHEHSDHTAGLRGLARHNHLKFFANHDTAAVLQERLSKPLNWQVFETGARFGFKDLEIESFAIPHDAHDPVGFLFENIQTQKRLAWVTDLGYIPRAIRDKISQVHTLVLESNYDPALLEADTKRPWSIKQRIAGRHGHLANEAALEFLQSVDTPLWEEVYLAHLSAHCNEVALVEKLVEPLKNTGIRFTIRVVDPLLSELNSTQLAVT